MNELGNKIKEARKRKGYSQEELAELAKINMRTIQRIENNENEPRGKTLNLICDALDLSTKDILDYGKHTDKNVLVLFQLSVIICLVVPLGNIILPFILWITQKDKVIGLESMGPNLLNFQITWTFFAFITFIIGVFFKITGLNFELVTGNILMVLAYCTWGILCIINIILPIIFAMKIKNEKMGKFYPNIIKLIK
ncbi:MAG: helix-turn-helix domain-containing protein [Algibacter sp.]